MQEHDFAHIDASELPFNKNWLINGVMSDDPKLKLSLSGDKSVTIKAIEDYGETKLLIEGNN